MTIALSWCPKIHQPCFFSGVGAGVAGVGLGVGVWLGVCGCGLGEEAGVFASGIGLGVSAASGVGAASSGVRWTGVTGLTRRLGDGAGVGLGLGLADGLGSTSISWRLFKKRSRNRFSSSLDWPVTRGPTEASKQKPTIPTGSRQRNRRVPSRTDRERRSMARTDFAGIRVCFRAWGTAL